MTEAAETLNGRLLETLRSSANPDGGWGYFSAKSSRLEPTCWALLALRNVGEEAEDEARIDSALRLIGSWQRAGGLLSDTPSAPANLAFNGLAAIAVQSMLARRSVNPAAEVQRLLLLLSGIVATSGVRLPRGSESRQDGQLAGWPWIDGTYSWVEPTSWCLLALKKASRLHGVKAASERVAEAESFLADRCGVSGGWTVGTSNVLGNELVPYVPTTAIALLALQDRAALPEVNRSVGWLRENGLRERSFLALSMTLIAMAAHGRGVDDVDRVIRAHVTSAGLPGNMALTALVLYALTGAHHGYAAIKV